MGPVDSVQNQEFTFSFTKVLYCDEPYVFILSVAFGDSESNEENSQIFTQGSGIRILCEGREIKYRFDMAVLNNYVTQYSSQTNEIHVTIQLEGVEDLARNRMNEFNHGFAWALVGYSYLLAFHLSRTQSEVACNQFDHSPPHLQPPVQQQNSQGEILL